MAGRTARERPCLGAAQVAPNTTPLSKTRRALALLQRCGRNWSPAGCVFVRLVPAGPRRDSRPAQIAQGKSMLASTHPPGGVRAASAAGLYYPGEADGLRAAVQELLGAVPGQTAPRLPKALVVPARGLCVFGRSGGVCVPHAVRPAGGGHPPRRAGGPQPSREDARSRAAVLRLLRHPDRRGADQRRSSPALAGTRPRRHRRRAARARAFTRGAGAVPAVAAR